MDKNNKKLTRKKSGRLIFAALITVFIFVGAIAAYNLIKTELEYNTAQNEYAELRQWAPAHTPSPAGSGSNDESSDETGSNSTPEPATDSNPDLSVFNPDYIGWIRIDGTDIDYPVVQGSNNTKYLNTTFMGDRNPSGTIFMDSECSNGFTGFAIIHGHNMRNGSMFAGLHNFRDSEFLAKHNEITIFTPEGEVLVFRIFDVILTDIYDAVFELPVEGQEAFTEYFREYNLAGHYLRDRSGILVLSTCTDGNRNERLLILTARQ